MTSYATLFGLLMVVSVAYLTLRGIDLRGIPLWRWAAFVAYLLLVGVVASAGAELVLRFPVPAACLGLVVVAVVYVASRFRVGPSYLVRLTLPRRRVAEVAPAPAGRGPASGAPTPRRVWSCPACDGRKSAAELDGLESMLHEDHVAGGAL